MGEKMNTIKKRQAKKLYDHNKKYVSDNINFLNWKQLSFFQRKQNSLYLIYIA